MQGGPKTHRHPGRVACPLPSCCACQPHATGRTLESVDTTGDPLFQPAQGNHPVHDSRLGCSTALGACHLCGLQDTVIGSLTAPIRGCHQQGLLEQGQYSSHCNLTQSSRLRVSVCQRCAASLLF